ncbi:hypothetical protein D3C87_1903100 [compost metagenome]
MPFNTVASTSVCTITAPFSGRMNCGNSASTNSAIFGLSRLVSNPSPKIRLSDSRFSDEDGEKSIGCERQVFHAR